MVLLRSPTLRLTLQSLLHLGIRFWRRIDHLILVVTHRLLQIIIPLLVGSASPTGRGGCTLFRQWIGNKNLFDELVSLGLGLAFLGVRLLP
jgi:hypothetical protein